MTPLLLYVAVLFIVPLGAILARAVYDPDMANLAPRTLAALSGWDGQAVPDEAAFAAMAADLKSAQANQAGGLTSASASTTSCPAPAAR